MSEGLKKNLNDQPIDFDEIMSLESSSELKDSALGETESAEGMEASFNDQELQDIMSEIESLESDSPISQLADAEMEVEAEVEVEVEDEEKKALELKMASLKVEVKPVSIHDPIVETTPEEIHPELKIAPESVHVTNLQRQIDEELEMTIIREREQIAIKDEFHNEMNEGSSEHSPMPQSDLEHHAEFGNDIHEAEEILSTVMHDESNDEPTMDVDAPKGSTHPVSFKAEGQMTFAMDFKMGEQFVNLKVNGDDGVTLHFLNTKIWISEEGGLSIEMDNGMKFNYPLQHNPKSKNDLLPMKKVPGKKAA